MRLAHGTFPANTTAEDSTGPRILNVPERITAVLIRGGGVGFGRLSKHLRQADRLQVIGELNNCAYDAQEHSEDNLDLQV